MQAMFEKDDLVVLKGKLHADVMQVMSYVYASADEDCDTVQVKLHDDSDDWFRADELALSKDTSMGTTKYKCYCHGKSALVYNHKGNMIPADQYLIKLEKIFSPILQNSYDTYGDIYLSDYRDMMNAFEGLLHNIQSIKRKELDDG